MAQIISIEANHGLEAKTIDLLNKMATTKPDRWNEELDGILWVDAFDALLETKDGKTVKTYFGQNKLHLPIFELEFIALWKGEAQECNEKIQNAEHRNQIGQHHSYRIYSTKV
eukprot:GHVP01012644.1.p1 GENE.GHVP01012644.1~~GHVP01012644.1.p1  ORF type:complete len:113 (+),score=17.95 GHVP01012644.1:1725-2063(+)